MNNANHLPVLSAIISRAVISRSWGTTTGNGSSCQEVQIMQVGNSLYISGNQNEHFAINTFLRMYGVTDINSFHKCLSYVHWAIITPHNQKVANFGFSCQSNQWGQSEQGAIDNFDLPPEITLLQQEKDDAKLLILNTPPQNHTWTSNEKRLGWFLQQLLGFNQQNKLHSTPTQGSSLLSNNVYVNASNKVFVIPNLEQNQVHAELNLLCALGETIIANYGFYTNPNVYLGGLKKACLYCNRWIRRYKRLLKAQWKVEIKEPHPDNRPQGSGAGYRPSSNKFYKQTGTQTYASLLFNGANNETINDVDTHETDYEWWGGYSSAV